MADDADDADDADWIAPVSAAKRRRLPDPQSYAAGDSENNPVLISDDDADTDAGAPHHSNLLEIARDSVHFVTEKSTMGALNFCFGDTTTTVKFTPALIELAFGERTASIMLTKPKSVKVLGFNSVFPPYFMAIRPANKLEDWTHSSFNPQSHDPDIGQRDRRFIVLYFDSRDDLVQARTAILAVCPMLKSASRELTEDSITLIDQINQRKVRNRTRSATIRSKKIRKPPSDANQSLFLQYPINGHSRIALVAEDLDALDPGEFLNDSIIDFYLRYLQETHDMSRFHIFSSFFYRKFANANPEDAFDEVRKWTRKVDIFSKDFLIVPICEKMHWVCLVICFPGMVPQEAQELQEQTSKAQHPCMLLFDSLDLQRHHVFRKMRRYLQNEWRYRKKSTRIFNGEAMPGVVVKVPEQTNNCDCGVFLLHYVESFLNDIPRDFSKAEIHRPQWFPVSAVAEKRDLIRSKILELRSQYNEQQVLLSASDKPKYEDLEDVKDDIQVMAVGRSDEGTADQTDLQMECLQAALSARSDLAVSSAIAAAIDADCDISVPCVQNAEAEDAASATGLSGQPI